MNKNCYRFRIVVGVSPRMETSPEFRPDDAEMVFRNCESCRPLGVWCRVCGKDDTRRGGMRFTEFIEELNGGSYSRGWCVCEVKNAGGV